MADVIIVGGGISGMLSAWYLRQAGAQVTLLERGRPGRESSWAGGGIISPLYPWRYPDAVNRLAFWSQQHFANLAASLHACSGIDPEYRVSGLLMPSLDPAEHVQATRWAQEYPARLQELDTDQLAALLPGTAVNQGHHLYLPEVAQVRNPRLLQALEKALTASGVRILAEHTVNRCIVEGVRVRGVETDSTRLLADKVVLCAGAWTGQLLPDSGIEPVRGQMLLFQAEPGLLQPIILAGDTYLIPRADGKILVGSTMEYVGFDNATTAEAREDLVQRALRWLPALAERPVIQHWAGLRPGIRGGIPLITKHPGIEGLFINAGQFRNGVVTGPASARLLSDLVLNRTPAICPDDFHYAG